MSTICDRYAQRWYILCYIGTHANALERLSSIADLQFYAPKFFYDQKNVSMHDVWTYRNYAFIYGSQDYIYQLKKHELTKFIFMSSTNKDDVSHPFVSEYDIEQLRKVERLNDGIIPLILSTDEIVEGDTVEILTGKFSGLTATAITRSGSKYRQTYLYIKNLFIIPLCRLTKEDFRIINFARGSKNVSEFQLSDDETSQLITSVRLHYGMQALDPQAATDCASAINILIGKCKGIVAPTLDTRIRLNIIMAVAYMTLGDNDSTAHHLQLSDTLLRKKVSKPTRLLTTILRFLCTALPSHYNEYIQQKQELSACISPSMQPFIDMADTLWQFQQSQRTQKYASESFDTDPNTEHWYCLSAPQKKTEAIRLFREQDIPLYAPIVSDETSAQDPRKNILKDHFFVRITYATLDTIRQQHPLFTILTRSVDHRKHVITYTDEAIQTFSYVNSLDLPNKEILQFTPQQEALILRSHRKTITLGGTTLQGNLMSTRIGNQTHQRLLFLLTGVAAIAIKL